MIAGEDVRVGGRFQDARRPRDLHLSDGGGSEAACAHLSHAHHHLDIARDLYCLAIRER